MPAMPKSSSRQEGKQRWVGRTVPASLPARVLRRGCEARLRPVASRCVKKGRECGSASWGQKCSKSARAARRAARQNAVVAVFRRCLLFTCQPVSAGVMVC